jgi:hypothetical protein
MFFRNRRIVRVRGARNAVMREDPSMDDMPTMRHVLLRWPFIRSVRISA